MGFKQRQLKIVSGGQTGVDRAALDVALELKIKCGGWCPKNRRAEDGRLSKKYPLKETPSPRYSQRTAWNVRDSDGTLILTRDIPTNGTLLTIQLAKKSGKPCLLHRVRGKQPATLINTWMIKNRIEVLNVAGPRESGKPGIYRQATEILRKVFRPYAR